MQWSNGAAIFSSSGTAGKVLESRGEASRYKGLYENEVEASNGLRGVIRRSQYHASRMTMELTGVDTRHKWLEIVARGE